MQKENIISKMLKNDDLTHWPYDYRYKLKCDIDMYHELSCAELISDDQVPIMFNKLFERYKDSIISITELACIIYMKAVESSMTRDCEALDNYNSSLSKIKQYIGDHYTEKDIAYYEQTMTNLIKSKKEN